MNNEVITQAAEILAAAEYCALALIDAEGYPTAATITPSKTKGIEWIAFGTGLGSNWAKRIEKCNRASVCCNSAKHNITLVGTIDVVTDLATRKEMWYAGLENHFSGPEDPGFCVLRFNTKRYSLLMLGEKVEEASGTL